MLLEKVVYILIFPGFCG